MQLEQVGTFPGVQNFSIRGQGINSSIPSVDPTVGVFVDGIYQSTTYGTVLDSWDLESIEVLRGPQGLLFGRNVTGGAVTVRTARPDTEGELGIKARVLGTQESRYGAAVAFEGPLVQGKLAGKIMLYYDKDDGYFKNVNSAPGATGPVDEAALAFFQGTVPIPGSGQFTTFDPVAQSGSQRNAGKLETKIARPTLVWTPTDTVEVALITEFGKAEGDGATWTVVKDNVAPTPTLPPGAVPSPPFSNWLINQTTAFPAVGSVADGGINKFSTTASDYGFADVDWKSATLEVNWDVWGGTLTNIFGWKDVEQASATDVDGTYLPAFTATGNTKQDQVSNELRFAKSMNDIWDTTIGIYYLDFDINYREGRFIQVIPPGLPPLPISIGTPVPNLRNLVLGGDMNSKSWGVFWNNDVLIAENLTLTAGVRYSDEEKKADIIGTGPVKGTWDNWTPKVGLRWQFSDDAQLYGFWTRGFRAGGFNFRNAKPGDTPPFTYPAGPTRQEEQDSYEVGLKSQVFDNRLRMNFAYFINDIKDLQRELNQPDSDVVVLQATINAGDAQIKGAEFEFDAVPVDAMRVYGAVGYLDGKYKRLTELGSGVTACPTFPNCPPVVGSQLPRLARWSFSIGGSYDFSLGNGSIIRPQVDYGYRDPNFYDDSNTQLFDRQRRLSASLNWFSPEDRWTVSLFGKNLRDEANYGNLTSIAGLWTAGPMQKGKEYGLQLQYRN